MPRARRVDDRPACPGSGRRAPSRRRSLSIGPRADLRAGRRPLVVQITSEAIGRYSPAEQRAVILQTNPEAVSLALRELAPDDADEKDFGQFLGKLKQMHIWPRFILYTPDEVKRLASMQKQGLIPFEDPSVLYVLGRFSILRTAASLDLLPFVAPEVPRFSFWSVCAFGRREAGCGAAAALLGGHARSDSRTT